ncbi:trypsin-like peptidase domain-containing protein [Candidatus Uhrbacteria bacterium]|nr:trypsin-like peptidase domain-containing protein [Candidatus Uhrbacteria bacterium]
MLSQNSKIILTSIAVSVITSLLVSWSFIGGPLAKYVPREDAVVAPPSPGSVVETQQEVKKDVVGVSPKEEEQRTIDVVKRILPSVVSIVILRDTAQQSSGSGVNLFPFDQFYDFGDFPFPSPVQPKQDPKKKGGKEEVGGGTGFIISSDGLILSNKHVLGMDNAEFVVIMVDGKRLPLKVLATDPFNDLAIGKIEGKNFPAVTLGDSEKIQIGQTVIAIGNSLSQYQNTVTKGVISGIGRRVIAGDITGVTEVIEGALQTDAAINPGNSGGPLVNLDGAVVGINTAISREGQLISFAIPINEAKRGITSVQKTGKIARSWLGVRYTAVTRALKEANNLDIDYGALITRGGPNELAVVPGGPADKAGLLENDIVLEVNGVRLDESHGLSPEIGKYDPGDVVTLKVLSKGKTKTIKVTLGEFKG